MLDASKGFDRVNYCTLFRELLKRDISNIYYIKLFYCEKRGKTGRRIIPFTICYTH